MKVQLAGGPSIPTLLDTNSFSNLRALHKAVKRALRPALDKEVRLTWTSLLQLWGPPYIFCLGVRMGIHMSGKP